MSAFKFRLQQVLDCSREVTPPLEMCCKLSCSLGFLSDVQLKERLSRPFMQESAARGHQAANWSCDRRCHARLRAGNLIRQQHHFCDDSHG